MSLSVHLPDAEVLISLTPEELGLSLLPYLAQRSWRGQLQLAPVLSDARGEPSNQPSSNFPPEYHNAIEEALREAWYWLTGAALLVPHVRYISGDMMQLSRRARELAKDPDPRHAYRARHFPKEALHIRIREDVWSLYHREKFDTAIFEAMKAVEVAVRDAAGFDDAAHGIKMMRDAWNPSAGPLSDSSQVTSEAEGLMHLFAGAIGSYKNPSSHRNVALNDPDEAAEIIMLANHLLRIVDARKQKGAA